MKILLFVLLIIILVGVFSSIRIVPQTYVYIIERLGKYHTEWGAGLHLKVPFIDSVANRVSLKEQVLDFPPQSAITKDNVAMQIDSIVFMKVTDAKMFTYGISNPVVGIENLAATTLRNIVGSLDFDATLTSRDVINSNMESAIDTATDPWGIKVTRVEVKNIQPPRDILEVMQKQMTAEREKRQAILEAEGYKQAAITHAEGDKQAKILAAEAERDAQIAVAEGRAKSIELVYEAESRGLAKLNETGVHTDVLKLKSIESMKDIADGNATKIYMPTDLMETIAGNGIVGDALGINKTIGNRKPIPEPDGIKHAPVGTSRIASQAVATGDQTQKEITRKYSGNKVPRE